MPFRKSHIISIDTLSENSGLYEDRRIRLVIKFITLQVAYHPMELKRVMVQHGLLYSNLINPICRKKP